MSTWYIFPSEEDLQHAAFHKYIDRVWKNGKWQYIYNKAKHKATVGIKSAYSSAQRRMAMVKRSAEKAIGVDKKRSLDRAKAGYQNSLGTDRASKQRSRVANARADYDQTLLGKAESMKNRGLNVFNKLKSGIGPTKTKTTTTLNSHSYNTVGNTRGMKKTGGYTNDNSINKKKKKRK